MLSDCYYLYCRPTQALLIGDRDLKALVTAVERELPRRHRMTSDIYTFGLAAEVWLGATLSLTDDDAPAGTRRLLRIWLRSLPLTAPVQAFSQRHKPHDYNYTELQSEHAMVGPVDRAAWMELELAWWRQQVPLLSAIDAGDELFEWTECALCGTQDGQHQSWCPALDPVGIDTDTPTS